MVIRRVVGTPLAGGGARGIGSEDLDIIRGTEALAVIALVQALALVRLRLPPLPLAIPIDLKLWCSGSFSSSLLRAEQASYVILVSDIFFFLEYFPSLLQNPFG